MVPGPPAGSYDREGRTRTLAEAAGRVVLIAGATGYALLIRDGPRIAGDGPIRGWRD